MFGGRARSMAISKHVGPAWPFDVFESLFTAVYQYELRAGWTAAAHFSVNRPPGRAARLTRWQHTGKT